jgi:DNA-binding CsgD family transcriptional regulator
MHMFLTYSPSHFAELGLGRDQTQGTITDREIELGKLLLPHLRRAVAISDLLDARALESRHMAEALDALHCSVVLTDSGGTILHANRAAECMLRDGSLITRSRGLLRARSPHGNRQLKDAISLATKDETRAGSAGIAIRLAASDSGPAFAHVLPMTGSDMRTRLQPKAVAAVFIAKAPDHRSAANLVASSFGLTRAEAQVLASALNGNSLAEVARSLGVARSTVKSHFDAIYRKTCTSRQAELVRLAMGFVSPLRS